MKKLLLGFLLLLTGPAVHFGQELITDRPDQTESSSTVPKGSLQIETGLLLGFTEEGTIADRQILAPTTLFRYGLTRGIELRVVNQFESVKDQLKEISINGISDLEVGTKLQLLRQEGVNAEIAFLSHLVLPTGSGKLSNEDYGVVNKLSIAHQLNDKVGIGYNLGYNYFGTGNGDLTYSLALGLGVTDKVGIYLESYGEVTDFDNHITNFDGGFTYLLSRFLQLDFSFGVGINQTMNYMAAGCSWLIVDKDGQ